MRALLVLALALMTAACAATPGAPGAPGAEVWGEFETGVYGEVGDIGAIRVAPPRGGAPDSDIEGIIRLSLERRGYSLDGEAPLTLRYMIHTALGDSGDSDLGIVLGGSVGSSSGVNDFGIGLDLPILGGSGSVRQVAFLFELALEGADGALQWRGRASGRTQFSEPKRIIRPLAPLLIDRLGRDTARRRFAR
ncbi:MAG: hypothetical protein QF449_01165 [Alphaproteobacteria bacterium]|jgi:hypothetical protein|nr:hypothetical protein [Alphaproteobacteria bacterium]MDP6590420.1 hypothetical protein [Alphaproteobacteria bacterium]MDP6816633.1 hypothetical protein [Alphaproteobacteria bacterium]|tara:strand:+ start:88 stop:666 length:579 start_codon:yes stop_codon:yes gene_type:complete